MAYSPNFVESQANAFIYNVNFRASLLPGPVTPYVTAGVGGIRAGGDGPGAFGNKFAFNYGGGLKLGLIGPIEGRFDLRGYSVRGIQDQNLNLLEATCRNRVRILADLCHGLMMMDLPAARPSNSSR